MPAINHIQMNIRSIFLFAAVLLLHSQVQSQNISWAIQAGGTGSDQGYDISADSSGNIYVSGWFSGTAGFGTDSLTSYGLQDIFIACYQTDGSLKWVKQAGSEGNDLSAGIVTDAAGNSFITGWFSDTADFDGYKVVSRGSFDMFVAKYNASGIMQWVKHGGGAGDDYGNRIALTGDGGACIGGSFRGTFHLGGNQLTSLGNRDILLAGFSADGEVNWVKSAGGTGEDRAYGIFQDAGGDYFITGFFSGTATFGDTELTSPAIISTYIAKMSNQENFQWVKLGSGSANDFARGFDIETDGEGNILATGLFSGVIAFENRTLTATGGQYDFDAYLIKLNPSGNLMWARNIGGNGIDQGTTLFVNRAGEIFLGGFYSQTCSFGDFSTESAGKSDVFAAKFNAGGDAEWVLSGGGPENDYAYGIVNDAAENIYLTGILGGRAGFGTNTLIAAGGNDIFAIKIISNAGGISFQSAYGELRIFPNPAQDYLQIDWTGINPGFQEVEYQISDLTGKVVLTKSGVPDHSKIDISSLRSGTYLFRILSQKFSFSGKFFVE